MNIIVLLKTVKYVYAQTGVEIGKNYIGEDDIINVLNPHDEFAIELALQLKDKYQHVHLLALSLGDHIAEEGLRKSLAMGVDQAIHIYSEDDTERDPWETAARLSSYIGKNAYDMILAGRWAIDDHAGLVGPYVAEQLGISHVSGVVRLKPDEGMSKVLLHRAVERGNREIWECMLPALFTIDKSANIPRHPGLHGNLRAKQQTVKRLEVGELDASLSPLAAGFKMTETIKLSNPKPKRKPGSQSVASLSAADRLKRMMKGGKEERSEGTTVVDANSEKTIFEIEQLLKKTGLYS